VQTRLAAMIALVAVTVLWWARRTAWSARVVAGSLGVLLLALSLPGPDALAASWNVDRFRATGRIDTEYLRLLSDDAVPALSRLPEPLRSCVLRARTVGGDPDGWAGWNLARHRAGRVDPKPLGELDRAVGCQGETGSTTGSR